MGEFHVDTFGEIVWRGVLDVLLWGESQSRHVNVEC